MIQYDLTNIFQMGWFNHHLVIEFTTSAVFSSKKKATKSSTRKVFKAKSIRTGELVAMKQMKLEGSVWASRWLGGTSMSRWKSPWKMVLVGCTVKETLPLFWDFFWLGTPKKLDVKNIFWKQKGGFFGKTNLSS